MPTDLMDKASPGERAAAPKGAPVRPPSETAAVEALLGEPPRRPWGRLSRIAGLILLLVALIAAGTVAYRRLHTAPAQYATTQLRRGDLSVTVTVTGTLAPVNQVDVSSELSGIIEGVRVEENDQVRKGQVLASLDTSRLRDQILLGEAAVASAEAGLAQAQATVRETGLRAGRLHRLLTVSDGGYPARADVDAADAALARAVAGERAGRAAVAQTRASLNTSRTNLGKAAIRSPVDGVVLTRKAEPGQTVAATLQAPVLFTLAEDMRRMELHADIDEADVGQLTDGQAASFTVDAYPGREYPARVTRVGLGSQTKEGVVTYTGVLSVDNSDLSLRPGMTASADIRTTTRSGVLLVPDLALRFSPPAQPAGASAGSALMPRLPRMGAGPQRRSTDPRRQQIWTLKDGQPSPIPVKVGASDGRLTEVTGPGLKVGMPVITEALGAGR